MSLLSTLHTAPLLAQNDTSQTSQTASEEPLPNSSERLPTLSIEADAGAEVAVGDIEHEDFAGRYSRIERTALSRSEIDLADVLAFESGIQQQQIGGYGSFSSITIRASNPSQTGLFLDGIRLNGAANAVVNLSNFDARSLESVDVYRGAAPLQLGATNLGGAVNLNSLSLGSPSTVIKLSAGSFSTLQANIAHSATYKKFETVATVEAGLSENDFPLYNDNGTPFNTADDRVERRNNADVRTLSILGKLAYQHNDNVSTDALLQHTQSTTGVPEWRNSENNEASYASGQGQLHIRHRIMETDGWNRRHATFFQWMHDHYDDRLSQVGLGAQNFKSQQSAIGTSTYLDRYTDFGKWAIIAELRREKFHGEDPLGRNLFIDAQRSSFTAGLGYTRFAFNERLLITPRLRLEHHISDWDGFSIAPVSGREDTIANPEISIGFDQSPSLRFSASLGRYYRVPTFTEMFGTQGLVVGNEQLNPEQGINAEVSAQWLPSEQLKLSATVFNSERSDTIVSVYDAQGIGRNLNTGSASISGVELETQWQLSRKIHLSANATLQNTNNKSDIRAFSGKQLPNQAAFSAYLRTNFKASRGWLLWGEATVSKDRFYDLGNFLPATDFTITNLGAQWQKNSLRVDTSVINVTDQSVEDFNGFPKPGRAFNVSFSYRY